MFLPFKLRFCIVPPSNNVECFKRTIASIHLKYKRRYFFICYLSQNNINRFTNWFLYIFFNGFSIFCYKTINTKKDQLMNVKRCVKKYVVPLSVLCIPDLHQVLIFDIFVFNINENVP